MQSFRLKSITAGSGCAVLRAEGEIDVYAAPQLRQRVSRLADAGTVHLIADLRRVEFLDSAGLGALVASRKELGTRGGSLTLVASRGRILRTLTIAGLSDAFVLHGRVLDAFTADQHWQAATCGEGGNAAGWLPQTRLAVNPASATRSR